MKYVVLETRYPHPPPRMQMSSQAVYGPFDSIEEAGAWREELHAKENSQGRLFTAWGIYPINPPSVWSEEYSGIIVHSLVGPGFVDLKQLRLDADKPGYTGDADPDITPSVGSVVWRRSTVDMLEAVSDELENLKGRVKALEEG